MDWWQWFLIGWEACGLAGALMAITSAIWALSQDAHVLLKSRRRIKAEAVKLALLFIAGGPIAWSAFLWWPQSKND